MARTGTNIYKERRQGETLKTLYVISSMLKQVEADDLDINAVLSGILKVAIKQLDAHEGTGNIILVNADMSIEHAWLAEGNAKDDDENRYLAELLRHGLAGRVIKNKQPDLIDDTLNDKRWPLNIAHPSTAESWSVICAPFIIRSRVVGAITIEKPGSDRFDQRDLNLLTAISSQAASSIENALLYEEQKRQLRISAVLNEASRIINSSLDINEIMQALLAQVNELLNAETTSIAFVDKPDDELIYQAAVGAGSEKLVGLRLPADQGIPGWVMAHAEPILVADDMTDERLMKMGDHQAIVCAPIQHKGEVLGTIQAINPVQGAFTQRDLELLVNLTNIASSAIGNAQQYARAQAAEWRYLNLFQDSISPMILTDMEHMIAEINGRASLFFGYERDTLIGAPISSLFPKDIVLPEVSRITGGFIRSFKSQVFAIEGQPIPVEVYVKQTSFRVGSELIQWQFHDLTHQVELEEMRRDLMAMLFHDLQSPLSNVMSSLELMRYEVPPGDDSILGSMLDIAYRSSSHLQGLINSLLDIDRLEAGDPIKEQTAVSVSQLLDVAIDMEKPDYERRSTQLIQEIEPKLPDVFVEQDMIQRVLINLLDNALRYSAGTAEVKIMARTLTEENQVLLSVVDQGPGIPLRLREVIFEKFQRNHKGAKSQGLGIGLAFCRLAVEAHGGHIWVEDAPGGGAQFNLTLPVVADND